MDAGLTSRAGPLEITAPGQALAMLFEKPNTIRQ